MVRDGLRRIIESEPGMCVSGQSMDGNTTLDRLCDTPCDILLLDLNMPAPNGPDLIRQVRDFRADLPILVLTMHNQPAVARAALKAGASGFVAKDNDPEVLLHALRQVAAGERYIEPRLAGAFDGPAPSSTLPTLSPREVEVLQRLAAGETNGQIAIELGLSEKTVSTHKTNVMAKLKLQSLADLVRFADQLKKTGGWFGIDS